MTIRTIRERVQRKDFRNCDLHMADGRVIHVATPDHIFLSPRGSEFVVFSPPPNECVQILDVNLVTGLTEKFAKKERKNGH
jgi:hypothetical protein